METALQTIEAKVVNVEEFAMTPDRIIKQVKLIQEVMQKTMVKDEHYGTIPGTKKPSLYKPGAEKLSVTFRLVPKYEIHQSDLPNGHREYQVICTLIHAPTGQFFGQGVGSCSTMEGKYRYRNAEPELTDRMVPKEYWELKKANSLARAQAMIGGKGFTTKKTDAGWFIAKHSGDKTEHDNPADYYNTVLKMAKKRAHVDAVLTATAASDIFTQDIEDMAENGTAPEKNPEKPIQAEQAPQPEEPPPPEEAGSSLPKIISEPQRKKLWAMIMQKELTSGEGKKFFEWYITKHPRDCAEIDGEKKLTAKGAHDFIDGFEQAFEAFTHE